MGKAEVGSTKYLSNKMKSKGLTRLRWYCSLCEKACRDENAFKMHSQSESHTRRALEAGQNFKSVQDDFSVSFQRDFVQQLKTSHGEKEIHANKFYNEYIARKDHVHLNATKWHSLTEFVKYLGRESICRVVEKEDGLFIAWIDDSPEALRRREAVRRKDMQEKGDEEREQMMLREQIKRAQRDAEARGAGPDVDEDEEEARELRRQEGEKIKLSFAGLSSKGAAGASSETLPTGPDGLGEEAKKEGGEDEDKQSEETAVAAPATKPVSLKFGAKPQVKNVFKNALAGAPKKVMAAPPKKMSEAERIMREEMERKRARETGGGPPNKRPRF